MSVKMKIKVTKEILQRSSMCGLVKDNQGIIRPIHSIKKEEKVFIPWEQADLVTNCAIALAVRELFPYAMVTPCTINPFTRMPNKTQDMVFPESEKYSIKLPLSAIDFIRRFDACTNQEAKIAMDEIEFHIHIPDIVIEKLPLPDIQEIIRESKTLELV